MPGVQEFQISISPIRRVVPSRVVQVEKSIRMNHQRNHVVLLLLAAALLLPVAQAGTLVAYFSPPKVMSTDVTGVTTETFDNPLTHPDAITYLSTIGTFTVPAGNVLPVIGADAYGGAGDAAYPNGSPYMYVGSRNSADATTATLTLLTPADYFGFWWSAGDPLNRLTIYDGGTSVATFQTSDIVSLLSTNPVALNGTVYQNSAYYGNPNTGSHAGTDSSEPFAYVSLVATGFTFDRIVLDNNGSSGFENDNLSVTSSPVDVPNNYAQFVYVKNVNLSNDPPSSTDTPEPATAGLLGAGLVGGFLALRRKRR